MNPKWGNVKNEHVLAAIIKLESSGEAFPEHKSTYLIFEGKHYPAKHIRGMAYEIANGEPIGKNDYSGGDETVNFLRGLGFMVEKTNRVNVLKKSTKLEKLGQSSNWNFEESNAVSQKHALQRLLQKLLGIMETEKKFDWMQAPDRKHIPERYAGIVRALTEFCESDEFCKSAYKPPCDFYFPEERIIIEYDERQHFSIQRKITLENYPNDSQLGFSKQDWISQCEQIRAKDGNPPFRDERRAFTDAVRDIEAFRNGCRLIRIRHGEFDWESGDAEEHLKSLLRRSEAARVKERNSMADKLTSYKEPGLDAFDLRPMEIELQRIRLCYLKWFFYFVPPKKEIYSGSGAGVGFRLLQSPNGRAFSLFPTGIGSVYVGGARGSVRLNPGQFRSCPELHRETEAIKSSLDHQLGRLRERLTRHIVSGDRKAFWALAQDYFWLKLGLHEYTFDAAYDGQSEKNLQPDNDARAYIYQSLRCSLDLSNRFPEDYPDSRILQLISHKLCWKKYAMCAFDCGPIATGKGGLKRFSEVASQRKDFTSKNQKSIVDILKIKDENDRKLMKREFAIDSLSGLYDFELVYHREPMARMTTFEMFERNREALRERIEKAQNMINAAIKNENIGLAYYVSLPD